VSTQLYGCGSGGGFQDYAQLYSCGSAQVSGNEKI
jgi:hypothetical protein